MRPRSFATELRRDRHGSISVEFAFIATILIATLAGIVDVMSISSINREIERSSTQIGIMVASCPKTDGSCVTTSWKSYVDRQANTLVRMPDATKTTVSIAQVVESSGALKVCNGNMTYIPSDVAASTLALLNDQDTAIIVLISTQYSTILPFVTQAFTGSSAPTLRGWTTTIQSSKAASC